MRVECNTIESFIKELSQEANHGRVYERVVRTRIDYTPEQDEAISHEVIFWATAIIDGSKSEWVLEFGGVAGSDEDGEAAGTAKATEWRELIGTVADQYQLFMREGKYEIF